MRKLFIGSLTALALCAASGAFAKGTYPEDPALGPAGPLLTTAQRNYLHAVQMTHSPYLHERGMMGYYTNRPYHR